MKNEIRRRRTERIVDGVICAALIAGVLAVAFIFAARVMPADKQTRLADAAATTAIYPPRTEEAGYAAPPAAEPEAPEIMKFAVYKEEPAYIGPFRNETVTIEEAEFVPRAITPAEEVKASPLHYLGEFQIYGYDICVECCGKTDGITASGTTATVGRTIASNSLPFGTRLYIDGIGERVVEDRGGLADNALDVLCNNHAECYAITGVYDVYVLE